MITSSDDHPEMNDFLKEVRFVARNYPNGIAVLRSLLVPMREKLNSGAALTTSQASIAKMMGRDVGETAILRATIEREATADTALLSRMPRERMIMLRTFAGHDPSAQATRARALGWDKDKPNYPAAP